MLHEAWSEARSMSFEARGMYNEAPGVNTAS